MLNLRSFSCFSLAGLALLGLSVSIANAALVSLDWKNAGDGLLTGDDHGLLWLDLSQTHNLSYNAVTAQLGEGGRFAGLRYATRAEVKGLWNSAGGNPAHYTNWSTQNNGIYQVLAPYWGDPWCERTGCVPGEGYAYAFTGDTHLPGVIWAVIAADPLFYSESPTQDFFRSSHTIWYRDQSNWSIASALVMASPVPVPTAAWLFATALIGLRGFAKLKSHRCVGPPGPRAGIL